MRVMVYVMLCDVGAIQQILQQCILAPLLFSRLKQVLQCTLMLIWMAHLVQIFPFSSPGKQDLSLKP